MADGVEEISKQFGHYEYQWRQLRDTNEGTSNVKRSADLYLPMPSAMVDQKVQNAVSTDEGAMTNSEKTLKGNAPWFHTNAAYSNYLQRARFPDIVANCLRGLVGIAIKTLPEIKLPPSLAHLENRATPDGLSLVDLFKRCVAETLLMGRFVILTDVDKDGLPVLIPYVAESFTNWRGGWNGDKNSPLFAIFAESEPAPEREEFSDDEVDGFRVLKINTSTGKYESIFYLDGVISTAAVEPAIRGKTLDKVPLTVINANKLGLDIGPSPMIGISDIAISIYQKDADMSQAEFLTCNPMLILTGVDSDDAPSIIGSTVSYAIGSPDAKAFYVEPEANCLQHVQSRIEKLFEEAVAYGGALIGPSKKAAESTETTRVKQAAGGATLRSVVENVEQGLLRALRLAAEWTGGTPESVTFDANLDFSELKLTAQEQTALLQAWMNRAISHTTYLENMKDAALIPDERTVEQEMDLIETQAPVLDLVDGGITADDDIKNSEEE